MYMMYLLAQGSPPHERAILSAHAYVVPTRTSTGMRLMAARPGRSVLRKRSIVDEPAVRSDVEIAETRPAAHAPRFVIDCRRQVGYDRVGRAHAQHRTNRSGTSLLVRSRSIAWSAERPRRVHHVHGGCPAPGSYERPGRAPRLVAPGGEIARSPRARPVASSQFSGECRLQIGHRVTLDPDVRLAPVPSRRPLPIHFELAPELR